MKFEDFVAEHGQSILRLAQVLCGDEHRAEDLTQTVLIDVYRHWRRVSTADNPRAYVHRMLVNAHLDWHRRRSSTERPTPMTCDEKSAHPDPAEGIAARDALRRALSGLAPRARAVLVLRYYADLDDAAIAEAMGLKPSTVRATASRALAELRGTAVDTLKETL